MYRQINEVVSPHIKPMKMVIQGECEDPYGTAGDKPPPGLNVGKISYGEIVPNVRCIIEMKGAIKGVGISYYTHKADKQYGY